LKDIFGVELASGLDLLLDDFDCALVVFDLVLELRYITLIGNQILAELLL
jgi:hypothetical protein